MQATPLTSASDVSDIYMPLALTSQARKRTEKLSPSARSSRYFQFRGEGEKVRELSVSNRAVQEIFINTMSVARSQISTSARATSQARAKQETQERQARAMQEPKSQARDSATPSKSQARASARGKSNEPSISTSARATSQARVTSQVHQVQEQRAKQE